MRSENSIIDIFQKTYSPKNLFTLFALVAFPVHIWSYLRSFYHVEAILNRTKLWDGISYIFYSGWIALLSTSAAFFILFLLSLLALKRWNGTKLVLIMSGIFIVVSIWTLLAQLNLDYSNYLPLVILKLYPGHIFRAQIIYYILIILLALFSVVGVVALIEYSQMARSILHKFIQGVVFLSTIYFALDGIGIIVFISRNFGQFIR